MTGTVARGAGEGVHKTREVSVNVPALAIDEEEVDITSVKDLARGLASQGLLRPGSPALDWIEHKPDRVPWEKWKEWYPMFLKMVRSETTPR